MSYTPDSRDNDYGTGTTEAERPEQHVYKSADHMYIWRKHKDEKTLTEIYNYFRAWEPDYETWIFRFGPTALGIAGCFSSSYINFHFRQTLFLLNYTRLTSYGLMFGAPGLTAGFLHYMFVTREILQDTRQARCSACLQVKGMTIQGLSTILYPMILVPFVCYPVARRLKNYSVPAIHISKISALFQFTKEMLRPIRGPLWAITAVQVLLGSGFTFYEQYSYKYIVRPKLDKIATKFSSHDPRPIARKVKESNQE